MNPTSFDNVRVKVRPCFEWSASRVGVADTGPRPEALSLPPQWVPEVTHFCRGTPVVLIGCKTDLRKDKEQLRKLRATQQEPITYVQVGGGPPAQPALDRVRVLALVAGHLLGNGGSRGLEG